MALHKTPAKRKPRVQRGKIEPKLRGEMVKKLFEHDILTIESGELDELGQRRSVRQIYTDKQLLQMSRHLASALENHGSETIRTQVAASADVERTLRLLAKHKTHTKYVDALERAKRRQGKRRTAA